MGDFVIASSALHMALQIGAGLGISGLIISLMHSARGALEVERSHRHVYDPARAPDTRPKTTARLQRPPGRIVDQDGAPPPNARRTDSRLRALGFDGDGGKCQHQEVLREFGVLHSWCLFCGVELEKRTCYNGQTIWVPVKGPGGCTHPDPVMVYTLDGLLVAWICVPCDVDGRFPWPEES